MAADLTRKTDDLDPQDFDLTDANGAVDLTASTNRTLFMRDAYTGTLVVNGAALTTQGAATAGRVRWSPAAGDVDTPGIYELEIEVTFTGGGNKKFPDNGYYTLRLVEDLEA